MHKKVAVIGGGFLGSLTALQLSNLGFNVEIFESKHELLKGASHLGEGKIHLGYTFGLSQESTYEQLIDSALNFAEIIENSICDTVDWKNIISIPFIYNIDSDSLISPNEFVTHSNKIFKIIQRKKHLQSYLGTPIEHISKLKRISEKSFLTSERSVDIEKLRKRIVEELESRENISTYLNCAVSLVETHSSKKYILWSEKVRIEKEFDYVINCTWEKRFQLDQLFWQTLPTLNYRTKLYVTAKTNLQEAAYTTVLGKYGDLVVFNTGRLYASDYLTGLTSFSTGVSPNFAERESIPEDLVLKHWNYIKYRFSLEAPDLNEITELNTFERTVVAEGNSDIDQIGSDLHRRSPYYMARKGNYISALGTKFTNIPQLAKKIVDGINSDGFK